MTTTPEKPAASKPKPAVAPEKSQPEASKPEASRPGTNQGESSRKMLMLERWTLLLC